MLVPPRLAFALLDLVARGADAASWHWLATNLPRSDAPSSPDPLEALKALAGQGWLRRRELDDGMDRWTLTDDGRARWRQLQGELARPAAGPADADDLRDLLAALRAGGTRLVRALIPLADDGPRAAAALRQALAADVSLAEQVAFAGATLPRTERGPFAWELLGDARPAVRRAVFTSLHPGPGRAVRTLPDDEWNALIRQGLRDPDPTVLAAADALNAAAAPAETTGRDAAAAAGHDDR